MRFLTNSSIYLLKLSKQLYLANELIFTNFQYSVINDRYRVMKSDILSYRQCDGFSNQTYINLTRVEFGSDFRAPGQL